MIKCKSLQVYQSFESDLFCSSVFQFENDIEELLQWKLLGLFIFAKSILYFYLVDFVVLEVVLIVFCR